MIHTLLVIAFVIFIVWLVLVAAVHVASWGIHLLWILILVALIWWAISFLSGRRRAL